ncbi:hypothetical protein J421_3196 [Gemmatirosa kalamazoonensis]|uniref:DUF5683 domain-containing protein n=1 Tax=Gemmatirosa kalamazoonensis TaxID=861299 RepID=W0RMT7_9BACT|nr:hypothetical protein [Gemmatirosa kalamazoonensis]AHG90733.1 hypothetical protein J421_3196 [Gemmatirosa kalamazoonensis]
MTPFVSRAWRARWLGGGALALVAVCASTARAQVPVPRPDTTRRDTTRRAPAPADTVRPSTRPTVPVITDTAPNVPAAVAPPRDTTRRAPRPPRAVGASAIPRPPISARRALIYSILVPGLGQSKLDRTATGAFFMAVEAGALAMVAKSTFDLAEAKAFRGDSLIATSFPVDTAGNPVTGTGAGTRVPNLFNGSLARARRLHLEDWIAVIAFNHLIAGAEAFVSANLWAVPGEVSVRPSEHGATLAMKVSW